MAHYRVIILPRAAADLEGIYQRIARDSPRNAASMVSRILDALQPLAEFPHRTVFEWKNPGLRHPVRSLPVRPYTIFFRVLEDQGIVRVLHVRHSARKAPRRL